MSHFRILSCRARSADRTALLPLLAPHPSALADSSPMDEYNPLMPTPAPIPVVVLDVAGKRPAVVVAVAAGAAAAVIEAGGAGSNATVPPEP